MPRTLVRMVALLRAILEGTVRHVPRIAPLLQLPMAPEQTIVLQRFFGDLHYSVGPASCPPAVVVPRF